MLDSISIQNFQSHKKSHLDLSSGVNVIIGPSDSGKTAILRALRWLIWNRPQGDAFRSDWGGVTKIHISLKQSDKESNTTITRLRDKINIYSLNSSLGLNNGLEFKAIKSEVPEEIQNALNVNEVNFQPQIGSHFLLASSSSEVAQHFNKIAHLDVIDFGLQNVGKWLRQVEQDKKSAEQHLLELRENLKQYDYLDKFEQEVQALEQLDERKEEIEKQILELNELTNLLDKIRTQEKQHDKLIRLEKPVDLILQLFKKKAALHITIKVLTDHLRQIKESDREYSQLHKTIKEWQKEFKDEFPDICPLCGRPKNDN